MTQTEHQALVDLLRTEIDGLAGIYLFGSHAGDGARPDSDIDLAILTRSPLPPFPLWELAQRLAAQAGREVDLVDLRQASTVFRMQIISTGERLFCAEPRVCEDFEDFVYADYARLNEERAGILEDIASRNRIHG